MILQRIDYHENDEIPCSKVVHKRQTTPHFHGMGLRYWLRSLANEISQPAHLGVTAKMKENKKKNTNNFPGIKYV